MCLFSWSKRVQYSSYFNIAFMGKADLTKVISLGTAYDVIRGMTVWYDFSCEELVRCKASNFA